MGPPRFPVCRRLWPVVFVLVTSPGALAQSSGGLTIRVTDSGNAPLAGATVTVAHEASKIQPHSELTRADGIAVFPVLLPGRGYTVRVSMPSFGTREQTGLRVSIGKMTSVTIRLMDEVDEHVRVLSRSDPVELDRTASSTRFHAEFVQELPVPGRFYQSILTLAPGVQDPDGDGNPIVHGSRSRDFKAVVGGVSNVDPLTGRFMALVNANSIEEIEVITAGAGVEFGRAQGGFANIVQTQGTNELEGTVGFLFRSSTLDGTGATDVSNLPEQEFGEIHPSLMLSGPVIKDRLWYRLAWERLQETAPVNVIEGIDVQERRQDIEAYQLTWQVAPRHKLAFQYQADPLAIGNFGIDSSTPAEASRHLDSGTRTYSLTWTVPYSPKVLVESIVAWQDRSENLRPMAAGVANSCIREDAAWSEVSCFNRVTGRASGSHHATFGASSQRLSVKSRATVYGGRVAGARHQLRLGFEIENERYFQSLDRRPDIRLDIIRPESSPGAINGLPEVYATFGIPRHTRSRATGVNWSLFFSDQIKPQNNLVITVGGRLDRTEIDAPGWRPFDPTAESADFLGALDGSPSASAIFRRSFTAYESLRDFVFSLARQIGVSEDALLTRLSPITLQGEFWKKRRVPENINLAQTNVSPFLSVAWDPTRNGKTKFAFSFRRYYANLFLGIPLAEVGPATTTLVFHADVGADGRADVQGLRSSISPAVNIETVDRNLRTPYNDEYRVAFERELWAETLLRAEVIRRRYRDQLQNVDLNHRQADFGRCRKSSESDRQPVQATPGQGDELVDPFTGERYLDADPGPGDGRIDDCVGRTVLAGESNAPVERPDGNDDLYVQNPGWGSVMVIGNYNVSDYEAFVLELIRRQYRSWEMQASYVWSRSTGNGEDFRQHLGLDATILDDEFGFQSSDQRHVFKVAAATITPWGFRLGGTLRWQSGLPYSILRSSEAFAPVPLPYGLTTYRPARPRLQYPTGVRNSERNPSQWLLSAKVTKELNVGRRINLQLSAEVFNLLNDGTYQVYNPDLEMGYQVNGVNAARREFGRRWQLGVRLAF